MISWVNYAWAYPPGVCFRPGVRRLRVLTHSCLHSVGREAHNCYD